jgi:hypothetical protein
MTISDKMIARGAAVGLQPADGESAGGFGNRVRKAEKGSRADKPAEPSVSGSASKSGGWRRF